MKINMMQVISIRIHLIQSGFFPYLYLFGVNLDWLLWNFPRDSYKILAFKTCPTIDINLESTTLWAEEKAISICAGPVISFCACSLVLDGPSHSRACLSIHYSFLLFFTKNEIYSVLSTNYAFNQSSKNKIQAKPLDYPFLFTDYTVQT